MSDLCTIVAIGIVVVFCLYLGAIALSLFGLGAVVWGFVLLPEQPLKGIGLIVFGLAICVLFSSDSRGPLK